MGASDKNQRSGSVARFLERLEVMAVLAGISLILISICVSTVFFGRLDRAVTTHNVVSGAVGEILRLDEVLTMSARLYVSAHDDAYKRRYYDVIPQLDAQIATVKEFSQAIAAGISVTDQANQKLVALEESAFTLCDQGRCSEGYDLLRSPEYIQYKEEYTSGTKKAFIADQADLVESISTLTITLQVIQLGSVANCLVVGLYLLRIRRKHEHRVLYERSRIFRGTVDILMDYFNNVLNRMGLFLVRLADSDDHVTLEDRLSMQKVVDEAALYLVEISSLHGDELAERAISRLSILPEQEPTTPVAPPIPAQQPTEHERRATAALKRILVVEDDPTSQAMLRIILEKRECAVVVVNDGYEALETLSQVDRQDCFAAVLMDIQMPRMDGITAIQEIRAARTWWSKVPVIAVTGQAALGDRERLLLVGFDSYVPKPVNVTALMDEITRFTGGAMPPAHLDQ